MQRPCLRLLFLAAALTLLAPTPASAGQKAATGNSGGAAAADTPGAGAETDDSSSPSYDGGTHVPFRATLFPLLSLPSSSVRDLVPSYAINLIGRNYALKGLELGLVFNSERTYVDGAQFATAGNWVGGSARGVQGALALNVSDRLAGVQATLGGNVVANDTDGVQIGSLNWSGGELEGTQLGLANAAGDVTGFQGGLLNVGGEVDGLQAGLLNIAEKSDVSLGLVNINWARPAWGATWVNEQGMLSAGLQHGSKHVYHMLRVGYQPFQPQQVLAPGIGFGGHFPLGALGPASSYLETEAVYNVAIPLATRSHTPSHWGQLRMTFGVAFGRRLAAFAGVSANGLKADRRGRVLSPPDELVWVESDHGTGFWPGFYGGIRF
ncbi:MAG: hypothetical protein ABEN55_09430 [Bradymonadaceae bacterium]